MWRFESDRVFLAAMVIVCAGCFALNWNHTANQGLLPYYEDFAAYIASGFASVPAVPTFPMWGYGWLWWLTGGAVPLIMLLQFSACLATTWWFVRFVERSLSHLRLSLFRPLVVLSFPWYMYHAVMQPNALAADCWIAAVILILSGRSHRTIILSGLCAGIALNLRSDFILLPIVLFIIWWRMGRRPRATASPPGIPHTLPSTAGLAVWLVVIGLVLTPWAYHYRQTTGGFGVTSSNGGHVLFISLGQLPGNPWGRTCSDGDPQMAALLATSEAEGLHSCSHEASAVLRRAYFRDILDYPLAYGKRGLYALVYGMTGGFYPGEILSVLPQDQQEAAHAFKSTLASRPDSAVIPPAPPADLAPASLLTLAGHVALSAFARILLVLGFLSAVIILVFRRMRGPALVTTALTIVVVQQLACVMLYANPMYFSGSYMFYMICLAIVPYAWRKI